MNQERFINTVLIGVIVILIGVIVYFVLTQKAETPRVIQEPPKAQEADAGSKISLSTPTNDSGRLFRFEDYKFLISLPPDFNPSITELYKNKFFSFYSPGYARTVFVSVVNDPSSLDEYVAKLCKPDCDRIDAMKIERRSLITIDGKKAFEIEYSLLPNSANNPQIETIIANTPTQIIRINVSSKAGLDDAKTLHNKIISALKFIK